MFYYVSHKPNTGSVSYMLPSANILTTTQSSYRMIGLLSQQYFRAKNPPESVFFLFTN